MFVDDMLLDAEVDQCLSIDDYKVALADVSIANSDDKYDSVVYDQQTRLKISWNMSMYLPYGLNDLLFCSCGYINKEYRTTVNQINFHAVKFCWLPVLPLFLHI